MSKTDDYLKKIADALNNYDPRTAGALVEEIASVFSEEIPSVKKGLDRFKGRISVEGSAPSYDFAGDLQKLAGKLQLHKEAELKKLESDPLRLALRGIDEHIYRCGGIIASGDADEAERLLATLVHVYAPDINGVTSGFSTYGYRDEDEDVNPIADLSIMVEKLERYKARIALDSARKPASEVNVSNSSCSNSSVAVEVTMAQAVKQIDGIPTSSLDDELKNELKLLLLDLESSKDDGKSAAEPKVKKVFAWLADKSVDVAIAAAPYLAAVLQSLA